MAIGIGWGLPEQNARDQRPETRDKRQRLVSCVRLGFKSTEVAGVRGARILGSAF